MASIPDISQVERLSALWTSPTNLQEGTLLLARLAREPAFLNSQIFPLLERAEREKEWYAAYRRDAPDGSSSLQVFVWPSGSRTAIHDHSSWGAFCCVTGSVLEERYERLDDRCRSNYARLKKVWGLMWSLKEGSSTVLPYEEGIHRIGNPNGKPAVSVHLYGPRIGKVDGRDYEPSCDYVCDRREELIPASR